MCYENGSMFDDGTLLKMSDHGFRWVCGDEYAGEWLKEQAKKKKFNVLVKNSTDQINNIWLKTSKDSLGPGFNYMKGYEAFWSYIPHFIHSPFYVYAYAFGDGLVNALYSLYRTGIPNFEDKYFDLLSAGGSKHHSELLRPFNLDATAPEFWSNGLELITNMIDDLEAMET